MKNPSFRRFAGVGAVAMAAAFALAACSASTTPGSTSAPTGQTPDPEPTLVRVGYIPSPSDSAQLLIANAAGYFDDENIKVELTPFQTGISMSNALTGGSIDVGVMGAVIANFPAKGQGMVFVLNNIQSDTQQIWASASSGITTVAGLAGHQIATTTGSAADAMLEVTLRANGMTRDDVDVINLDMPAVANTFVTGGVPAAALWIPFDTQVEATAPDSVLLAQGSDVGLALTGGWVANNDFYASNHDTLVAMTRAWQKANDALGSDIDGSLTTVCTALEEFVAADVCERIYLTTTAYTNDEWAKLYADGTATTWISNVQSIFESIGAVKDATKQASEYFDATIFAEARGQ